MLLSAPAHLAIRKHSFNQAEALVALRRALHQHPELSGQESWTAATLRKQLEKLGWEVRANLGGHSLVADWVTDPRRPTVALRVDLDGPAHPGRKRRPLPLSNPRCDARLRA